MSNLGIDELAEELSEFAAPETKAGHTPYEERVIAGFEEILRFIEEHGRMPQHGDERDIFERLYAVRLDRLRALPECRAILEPLDPKRFLEAGLGVDEPEAHYDVDELAAELGGTDDANDINDITVLRNVRTTSEKRAAEEIAQRKSCDDFESYAPLFERVQRELKTGARKTRIVRNLDELKLTEIQAGEFFIVEGQLAYVADVGEKIRTAYEREDSRLRVIYGNRTESDVLQRSFQRALHRDKTARLITNPSTGPLFGDEAEEGDQQSGTIYVLRSNSDLPKIAACRDVLHKIGVTGQKKVASRFTDAKNDPTFLLADVEVIATYDLYHINRVKLENLIHRVFDSVRLDIEIKDRFSKIVRPREWFLVPVFVIDEAVDRIKDRTIDDYVYDKNAAKLVKIKSQR